MKTISTILFCCFIFLLSIQSAFAFHQNNLQQSKDSTIDSTAKEDKVIEEVVASKVPQEQKVEYVSQVTKYGFKNLFSNSTYNPQLAYSMQVNPNAEQFIQDYMQHHGRYLQKMKGWGMPYFNLIESELVQYGLPKELKYVAVIESNLSSGAVSNKGAVGPWQLMPATARRLGLVVNAHIDERYDYNKSTHAASKYLLELYSQLHDWLLVMAAYNCGIGNVNAAIVKSRSKNFWDLQFYLPEESRTYVKRFIATHYIMEGCGGVTTTASADATSPDIMRTSYPINKGNNPYNNKPALSDSELSKTEVQSISGRYMSAVIAKNISMDMSVFEHYNPGFDNTISTTGNFALRLPSDKMQLFTVNKYQILNESVQVLLGSTNIPDNKMIYQKSKTKKKQG